MLHPSGKYSLDLLQVTIDNLRIIAYMFPMFDKNCMDNIIKQYDNLKVPLSDLRKSTQQKKFKSIKKFIGNAYGIFNMKYRFIRKNFNIVNSSSRILEKRLIKYDHFFPFKLTLFRRFFSQIHS
jgi:hypothetical protein